MSCLQQAVIGFDKFYFGAQAAQSIFIVAEKVAVHLTELIEKDLGLFTVFGDQRGECIETIKKKMWIHLTFECFKFLPYGELFHFFFFSNTVFPLSKSIIAFP